MNDSSYCSRLYTMLACNRRTDGRTDGFIMAVQRFALQAMRRAVKHSESVQTGRYRHYSNYKLTIEEHERNHEEAG